MANASVSDDEMGRGWCLNDVPTYLLSGSFMAPKFLPLRTRQGKFSTVEATTASSVMPVFKQLVTCSFASWLARFLSLVLQALWVLATTW